MLSVPLSITGALLALKLTGNTLNVYSQIGLVTLIGLITKHGILIVEFANQLREQNRDKLEAVIESALVVPTAYMLIARRREKHDDHLEPPKTLTQTGHSV